MTKPERCKYLDYDVWKGKPIEEFCTYPNMIERDFKCPFGSEVYCDLNAHLKNLVELSKKVKQ